MRKVYGTATLDEVARRLLRQLDNSPDLEASVTAALRLAYEEGRSEGYRDGVEAVRRLGVSR